MQSTTTYRRGDVVLVPFPFTDLSGLSNRPALVVSRDSYNRATNDLILAQITGNISMRRQGDYQIAAWQQAGLRAPSVIRTKLVTLAARRVRRNIGQLPPADMGAIEHNLRAELEL